MKQKDYYAMLGVNKRSTNEEIKLEYRKLAKKYHPDANLNDPNAEEKFKELNAAYDTLTNKEKRIRIYPDSFFLFLIEFCVSNCAILILLQEQPFYIRA